MTKEELEKAAETCRWLADRLYDIGSDLAIRHAGRASFTAATLKHWAERPEHWEGK